MSRDNYSYEEAPTPKKSAKLEMWDMLSIVTLILTLCVGVYFVSIFLFPQSALNPLKPNPFDVNAPPTPTITQIQLDATWTVAPSQVATETQTLLPTYTLEPSATPFSMITPTVTFTPTAMPKAPFSAVISYTASTGMHPDLVCNWQGIGGMVLGANNADMFGMVVTLNGFYNGKSKSLQTVSGAAPIYGRSGFEFFLGTEPIASKGELYLQLLDQAALPLSDRVYMDTFTDCSKNLVVVRFKKNP
jgi:hypothetical protein